MFTVIGLVVVFASVLGGFALAGGSFHILIQPSELVVIGGAALGGLIVSAPGSIRGQVFGSFREAFSGKMPAKADYIELLKLQYEVYTFIRKNGAVALDEHVMDLEKSSIFSKYPGFLANHEATEFFRDALKQIVNGTASPEELDVLLDNELETHHEEAHVPIALIRTTSDALPGLGIVAAVLGIIITMGHLDQGPEAIGHHVAAALVGTFLGILMSYGLLSPLATTVEVQANVRTRYLRCIKDGLLANLRGASPIVAVEFARKSIFSSTRPTSEETDAACREVKSTGA
ncbi:MAG TPA: flagellar motor stator protein MotA [Candidatus Binatia bacterium]|nr:flagellar motor stator protein MotA [Candidatus Binatia bacterium]